uniref:3'-5' exonuclease domain-containing protein n=1 Tax=Arundo donax TaxID=35708 RepID=A0A0A9DY52_ARUDO
MAHALYGSELDDEDLVKAREHLKQYVKCFMESESYVAAVTMITRFSIQCCDESFLIKLIECNQFEVAEECATFMGKEMICFIIQKYLNMKMLKSANKLVKEHDLTEEFPDVNFLYKESLVKKLAEKGCWDIAEVRAKKETKLMEYLVYLAMEAGYMEKVDELCQRYSLEGYVDSLVREDIFCGSDYLDLKKLGSEEIVWVDEIDGLLNATSYIEGCKIIGMDCEWKPNFEKNSKPNKVSVIQIASDKKAFIFDLIKLYEDDPKALDSCFRRIMCSSNILKLGYDVQCDLHQLAQSYGELECFQSYEMLLDIQKLFDGATGGLSGLSKKILGAGLNKARRNSNWELRPLSQNQKEYAALDAVVLVHIFHEHMGRQPQFGVSEGCKAGWKSHIVSRVRSPRKPLRF